MSSSTVSTEDRVRLDVARLVRGLEALAEREDRAALAALRRGLGKRPGEAPEMFPVIVPLLPHRQLWPWDEECAYLIASLFSLHPVSWRGEGSGRRSRNLGASLRRLRETTESDGPERRLIAILNSDAEDLGHHLRGVVALLRAQDVPVDWEQLARDLLAWDHPSRDVQRRWATAYWGEGAMIENDR